MTIKFILFWCVLFVNIFTVNASVKAAELPAIKELYFRHASNLLQSQLFFHTDPFQSLYNVRGFLIPELHTNALFEYDLERNQGPFVSAAQIEINGLVNQVFSTSFGQQMLNTLKRSGIKKLKFFLVFFRDERRILDGWTNGDLNTYIFLGEPQINKRHLLRVFTHELAQITQNNSLPLLDADFSALNFSDDIKDCGLDLLSRRPDIRILISTLRAFQAEKLVLRSLNIQVPESYTMSCGRRVARLWDFINLHGLSIDRELYRWIEAHPPACSSPALMSEFLKTLSESDLGEKYCNALVTPILENKIVKKGSFGPRPPIGAGGD